MTGEDTQPAARQPESWFQAHVELLRVFSAQRESIVAKIGGLLSTRRAATGFASTVIVAAHAVQEVVPQAQCRLVVHLLWLALVRQVDLASPGSRLTVRFQNRESVAVVLTELAQIYSRAELVLEAR